MRVGMEAVEDERWDRRPQKKKQHQREKRKREASPDSSSMSRGRGALNSGVQTPKKQRRGALVSRGSFKSKKRYKRR